jgi:hypothetical protein
MERILKLGNYRESGRVQMLEDKFCDAKNNLEDIGMVSCPRLNYVGTPLF